MKYHFLRTRSYTPFLYLLPALSVIIVFQIIPIFYALYLSFFNWDMITPKVFIGLRNYSNLLLEPEFWKAIGITFYYVGVSIPLGLSLSLFIAVLLDSKIRALPVFRTAYFLPYITSTVAVSLVWLWIYNSKSYGLLNYMLGLFGIQPIKWLSDPTWAMPAVILMLIWKNLGFNVVIFLTRLQSIDPSYYEAASIDGASPAQQFRFITWPLLQPTLLFLLTMSTIFAFRIFPSIYVLTPTGGPNGSTTTAVFYLFKNAYEQFRMGYAASIAYMVFFMILIITFLQRRLLSPAKDIEY
ncbi:MAG: sugar ABC transporter permease [Spirochaetes bacterium]|nr:sugar ABC transporter permease [Spirochaetota bacterium]